MSAGHAAHFESLEKRAHAARLGMWVFLSSELLLFAGLFTLYAAYRAGAPAAFHEGIAHSTKLFGSLNTVVLLVGSAFVALALAAMRRASSRQCALLLGCAMLLGATFLAIKFHEYGLHFREGIYPGGAGVYFAHSHEPSLAAFWTLYFVTTGLHALHVSVGIVILGVTALNVLRGKINRQLVHPLENAALYWHLIDVVWIFLWPLFYLA